MKIRRDQARRLIPSVGIALAIHAAVLATLPISSVSTEPAPASMVVTLISQAPAVPSPAPRETSVALPKRTDPKEPLERVSAVDTGAVIESGTDTGAEKGASTTGRGDDRLLNPAVSTEPANVVAAQSEPEKTGPSPLQISEKPAAQALPPAPSASIHHPEGPGLPEKPISPSGRTRLLELTPTRYRPPSYPESARVNGIEGTVEVRLIIDGRGRVGNTEVIRSSGSEILDNEVLRTVRLWRFPRENAGKQSVHRIVFRLEG